MALLHKAEIVPGKIELLARWLPSRSWYSGPATEPERVAAARFDDPAGEVGIETMILRSGDGTLLHVPLTYRGAPLAGAGQWLVGTTEHSVLGTRWVYDAVGDPVYAAQLAEVIRTAGQEAVEEVASDAGRVRREPSLRLRGSGSDVTDGGPADVTVGGPTDVTVGGPTDVTVGGPTDVTVGGPTDVTVGGPTDVTEGDPALIRTGTHELTVLRVLGPVPSGAALTGSWDGGSPVVLATLAARP